MKSFEKSLYNHSNPILEINEGAFFILPPKKSKIAPQGINNEPGNSDLCSLIQLSCLGVPNPTQITLAPETLISSKI